MKVTLPEKAVNTLTNILKDNQDKPKTLRVYFAGFGCSGPSFGLALDDQKDDDVSCEVEGLQFIMNANEFKEYGNITIEDTDYGFAIIAENMPTGGGCGGGCSGCGH